MAKWEQMNGTARKDNRYLNTLLTSPEFVSSAIYYPLIRDILREEDEDPGSLLLLSDQRVDVGEMEIGDCKRIDLGMYNRGNDVIAILQPVVSCPCIKIDYPARIPPRDSAHLSITINAIGSEGYFEKEVILTTSARNGTIVIPVIGTINNHKI